MTWDSSNNLTQQVQQFHKDGISSYDNSTYGAHGNVLTSFNMGFTGTDTTTYYNLSQYFQKGSITDKNSHTSTFGVGDNTGADPSNGSLTPANGNKGNVLWVRDAGYTVPANPSYNKQFIYTYNTYGQKASETNLNGVVTTYTYGDAWGNLTQVIQDPHVILGDTHLARTTNMTYDICGHVLQSTDPAGQVSTFNYNNLGQPVSASFPAKGSAPAENISYIYGANGRTDSVADNRGSTSIAYEPGSERVSSVTDPVTGTMSYTYGLTGERNTMTLPGGGTWTYQYGIPTLSVTGSYENAYYLLPKNDADSLSKNLVAIIDDQGRKIEFGMDMFGHLQTERTNETYTTGGSPTLISYQDTNYVFQNSSYRRYWVTLLTTTYYHLVSSTWVSAQLWQNSYTYDYAGQRLTNLITDNTGSSRTETYGYDEINRLTSVNYGDGQTQSYIFDPMGNRTSKTDTGGGINGTESYTYNNANMLLTRGSNTYTNDSDGNTLTGGGRTNTWDSQNRLVSCAYSGNTTTTILGSDGIRHRSIVNGTTTDYALDSSMMVRELRAGSAYATYLQGAHGPEYRRDNGTPTTAVVRWYVYVGLGSVVAEVDLSGNVTSSRKYDAYGLVRGGINPGGTSKQKFVGALGHTSDDESGLVYMRARYMDPNTGRFISEDPAYEGINWFRYARNNPVCLADKTGKNTVDAIFLFLTITFGITITIELAAFITTKNNIAANIAAKQAIKELCAKLSNAAADFGFLLPIEQEFNGLLGMLNDMKILQEQGDRLDTLAGGQLSIVLMAVVAEAVAIALECTFGEYL